MSATNPPAGKDYLTDDLPQELLDQIIGNLDLGNQLKLRLVFNKNVFEERIVKAMRPTISNLFVSPSKVSLRNFKRIAESSFFQNHVTSVTFVGSATDGHDTTMDLNGGENIAAASNEHALVEQYLASEVTPLERFRAHARHCEGTDITAQQAVQGFALYQTLLANHKAVLPHIVLNILTAGLRNLPKLKHLVIADDITRDGLNADVAQYLYFYGNNRAARGFPNPQDDSAWWAALYAMQERFEERGDDILFDALKDADILLESLSLGELNTDMPNFFPADLMIQPRANFSHEALSKVVSQLRRLTASCADFSGLQRESCRDFWQHIATNATCLQDLTLIANHGGWKRDADKDWAQVHRYFFDVGDYPKLTKFRIVGCYATDTALVNDKELMGFLVRHRKSLREVELVDVLPSTVAVGEDVCRTIQSLLNEAVTNLPELLSFKTRIYRRHRLDEHDEEICGGPEGISECSTGCESYHLYFDRSVHRQHIEKLAETLQVDLRAGAWDFGQYVMRKLAQRKEEQDQHRGAGPSLLRGFLCS